MDKLKIIGGFFALISVVLGAIAAHKLKDSLNEESLKSFETGVKYMMYHGLAMIIVSNSNIQGKNNLLIIFSLGIVLFSFSIFLLSTQSLTKINFSFLGPVTPIGGLTLIIGWIIFIINSFRI
ncbi:MAG: DUF423 domain-containing protein [Flavobacteriaceae bacterium]|tara:strand:+ start:2036 stop:2404 length:369 start_codon:yes stop_codon:yes gene_type:complete